MRKFFEKFGEVDDALVVFDKICNKSRGFGFVTMKDPLRTEQILKNQPHIIDGKLVECRIAVSKEEMFHHKQSVENNEIQKTWNLIEKNKQFTIFSFVCLGRRRRNRIHQAQGRRTGLE